MEAESQAAAVNVISQRLKPRPAIEDGNLLVAGSSLPHLSISSFAPLRYIEAGRAGFIPLDVHDDVLPAVLTQGFRHEIGLRTGLRLGHSGGESVPAVPSHRRRLRPGPKVGIRRPGAIQDGGDTNEKNHEADPAGRSLPSVLSFEATAPTAESFAARLHRQRSCPGCL